MRRALYCPTCADGRGIEDSDVIWFPLNTSGLYRFSCPDGHDVLVVQRDPLYAILAETAVQAIVDGYFREGVTSFMASLERFMEHYVKVVWVQHERSAEDIDRDWKMVASQSERQLGLFYGTYIAENGVAPAIPDVSAFRNAVVHKGHLPTQAEVLVFGQKILDFVQAEGAELSTTYVQGWTTENHRRSNGPEVKAAEADANVRVGWLAEGILYDGTDRSSVVIDLASVVKSRRASLERMGVVGVRRYE